MEIHFVLGTNHTLVVDTVEFVSHYFRNEVYTANIDWCSICEVYGVLPYRVCLSGRCILRPTRVARFCGWYFRLCMLLTVHASSPLTTVVCLYDARFRVVVFCVSCRRIDHPSKVKQKRMMLFRRCKGVMKLCCDIAMDSTSWICMQTSS